MNTILYLEHQGEKYPIIRFAEDDNDFMGYPITFSMDMTNTVTPYGERLQTVATIYPRGDIKGAYVGTCICNPKDTFNYDYALKLSLFRAGQDMAVRNLHRPEFLRFAMSGWTSEYVDRIIKTWAGEVVHRLYRKDQAPSQLAHKQIVELKNARVVLDWNNFFSDLDNSFASLLDAWDK
jgi:hypothetical protein